MSKSSVHVSKNKTKTTTTKTVTKSKKKVGNPNKCSNCGKFTGA